LRAVEAEEFALRVLGLDNSVGVEGEAAAGGEIEAGDGVAGVGLDAEGQCAGELDFIAVEVGREMAGVGDGDKAVGGDAGDESGGEAAAAAADEALVEIGKQFGRGFGVFGNATDGADENGDEHGSGETFAGDIAQDEEHAAIVVGKYLEEVAADLLGGLIDGIDRGWNGGP